MKNSNLPNGAHASALKFPLESAISPSSDLQCSGESGIDKLVRTLVQQVPPSDLADNRTQRILLDTTIEGMRYLLVRLPKAEGPTPTLSPREQEIVRMVSQGFPNKIIADVLNISSWTVSTHLRRIFAKLGVTSRAAMVAHLLEVHATRGSSPLRS